MLEKFFALPLGPKVAAAVAFAVVAHYGEELVAGAVKLYTTGKIS